MRCARFVAAMVVLASCSSGGSDMLIAPPTPVAVGSVSVVLGASTLSIGSSTTASATVRDVNGGVLTGRAVTWQSLSASVAIVASSGLVTAVGAGTTSIMAISGGYSGSATLTVLPPPPAPVAPGTIYVTAYRAPFVGGPLTQEIVAFDSNTGVETNLTLSPGIDGVPVASPDGQFLLFYSNRNFLNIQRGEFGEPFVMRKDGTGLTRFPYLCSEPRSSLLGCDVVAWWIGDGRLRYKVSDIVSNLFVDEIGTFSPPNAPPTVLRGSSVATMVATLRTPAFFSASGQFEAYTRDAGLYVMAIPGGQVTTLAAPCLFVSACEGQPVWAPNGQFVYIVRNAAIWEFSVPGGVGRQLYAAANLGRLAVSPDGLKIAFAENGVLRIRLIAGSSAPSSGLGSASVFTWSPDSKSLAMMIGPTLVVMNADGTGTRTLSTDVGVGFYNFRDLDNVSWGR